MSSIINDGLSPALYAAVVRTRSEYSRSGHLSTTSSIDSPRIRVLESRHDNEIVIPASTLLPSFVGTCVHREIERYECTFEKDGIAQEKEFVIEIGGIRFSGRPDWYSLKDQEVGDEKTTSVWTYTFNRSGKKEHVAQCNINGYLIREWGYPCTKGWVELIFLDWKLSSAQRDSMYPRRSEIIRLDSLWSDAECRSYIEDRVRLHLAAEQMADEHLPLCTESEQWRKPSGWAVRKKDAVRATKICDTMEDAEKLAANLGRGVVVEERPGERTRCEYYCVVKQWCNQYREEASRNV